LSTEKARIEGGTSTLTTDQQTSVKSQIESNEDQQIKQSGINQFLQISEHQRQQIFQQMGINSEKLYDLLRGPDFQEASNQNMVISQVDTADKDESEDEVFDSFGGIRLSPDAAEAAIVQNALLTQTNEQHNQVEVETTEIQHT